MSYHIDDQVVLLQLTLLDGHQPDQRHGAGQGQDSKSDQGLGKLVSFNKPTLQDEYQPDQGHAAGQGQEQ